MSFRDWYCGQVDKKQLGQDISLSGWVGKSRDHGGVIFIDLFDHTGVVQLVFNPDSSGFKIAEKASTHSVLCIKGTVENRPEGTVNPNLSSGEVEVKVTEVVWNNIASPLGFDVNDPKVGEDVRAQHRVLDLRSSRMQNSLRFRAKMISYLRKYLEENNFLEVETPILTRSTPEGARDYLVPSRNFPGQAFALPQSPQQFKQMLMMGGIDRYYQVARCFRDEDLRADRQPEFTQLDIEASFMNAEEICSLIEKMVHGLVKELLGEKLEAFPTLSYHDAMSYYGKDAPDLRNPLKLCPLDDILKDCDFDVFKKPANDKDGRVCAFRLPMGVEKLSRKDLDGYTDYVLKIGAKGLAYIKVNQDGLSSPILKFLSEDTVKAILDKVGAKEGDIVFFGAGKTKLVNLSMSALMAKLAKDYSLLEEGLKFVWVKEFPLFEKTDEGLTSVHHPFTAPMDSDLEDLENANAQAYDLVLNGYELGGGSIRIANPKLQKKIFELLGLDDQKIEAEFGHLMHALEQGCPFHGGIAFGLDRMAMVLQGIQSMRDVIAFPKTQTASCALTKAPSEVTNAQWRELGLKVIKGEDSGRS